jgi:hypothetical protein
MKNVSNFCVSCGNQLGLHNKYRCGECIEMMKNPNYVVVSLILPRRTFHRLWFISGGRYGDFVSSQLFTEENNKKIGEIRKKHKEAVQLIETEQRAGYDKCGGKGRKIGNDAGNYGELITGSSNDEM